VNTELLSKSRAECLSGDQLTKALYAKIEGDHIQLMRGAAKLGKKLKSETVIHVVHSPIIIGEGIYTVKFNAKLRPEKLRELAAVFTFGGAGTVFILLERHELKITVTPNNDVVMKVVNGLPKALGAEAEFQAATITYFSNNVYDDILNSKEQKGVWRTAEIFVPKMPEIL